MLASFRRRCLIDYLYIPNLLEQKLGWSPSLIAKAAERVNSAVYQVLDWEPGLKHTLDYNLHSVTCMVGANPSRNESVPRGWIPMEINLVERKPILRIGQLDYVRKINSRNGDRSLAVALYAREPASDHLSTNLNHGPIPPRHVTQHRADVNGILTLGRKGIPKQKQYDDGGGWTAARAQVTFCHKIPGRD